MLDLVQYRYKQRMVENEQLQQGLFHAVIHPAVAVAEAHTLQQNEHYHKTEYVSSHFHDQKKRKKQLSVLIHRIYMIYRSSYFMLFDALAAIVGDVEEVVVIVVVIVILFVVAF